MNMFSFFSVFLQDGPEYSRRKGKPFKPSNVTISRLRSVVPKGLREKNTLKSLAYVCRDIFCAVVFYRLALLIEPYCRDLEDADRTSSSFLVRWCCWSFYWFWQSIVFAGFFCMAHEAGHGSLSSYSWVNHAIGYILHTFILVPYAAWRSGHLAHHKAVSSIERDEIFIPRTRSYFGLPPEAIARASDYYEILEETPLVTLLRAIVMVVFGWYAYIFANVKGSPRHPPFTNHFLPSSTLFKPHERRSIVLSNIGLCTMVLCLWAWTKFAGFSFVLRMYILPYLLANVWIVMFTYLQHNDPTVPVYRGKDWTFVRGALSTIDRPFFGWIGRFFFHNASHNHISHHLFSSVPFYNQPEITERIKQLLGDDYNYDSTVKLAAFSSITYPDDRPQNSFRALYRNFDECMFVEDVGGILFHKNKQGQACRYLEESEKKFQ